MIELREVTKEYSKGVAALNGINLKIEQGEFVFIVGDSGSGKSTQSTTSPAAGLRRRISLISFMKIIKGLNKESTISVPPQRGGAGCPSLF